MFYGVTFTTVRERTFTSLFLPSEIGHLIMFTPLILFKVIAANVDAKGLIEKGGLRSTTDCREMIRHRKQTAESYAKSN